MSDADKNAESPRSQAETPSGGVSVTDNHGTINIGTVLYGDHPDQLDQHDDPAEWRQRVDAQLTANGRRLQDLLNAVESPGDESQTKRHFQQIRPRFSNQGQPGYRNKSEFQLAGHPGTWAARLASINNARYGLWVAVHRHQARAEESTDPLPPRSPRLSQRGLQRHSHYYRPVARLGLAMPGSHPHRRQFFQALFFACDQLTPQTRNACHSIPANLAISRSSQTPSPRTLIS